MQSCLATKLRPSPALVVAIAALVVALAGVAYATIPDSNGMIHGCYLKAIGSLRVIDPGAGQHCTALEVPIQWSQTGPQGPAGPQGPVGPASTINGVAAGGDLAGTYPNPTFAGAVLYESTPVTLIGGDAYRDVEADAYCPEGQKAIAGGGNGGANFVTFYNSGPTTDRQNIGTVGDIATGWRVDAHNPTSTPTSVFAYVLCIP